MVHPDGTRFQLLVQNNVPVLPAASSTDPRPAEGETAPPDESEADSRPVPQPSSTPDPRLGIPVNHELTHFPKLAGCEICQQAKAQNRGHRKSSARASGPTPEPTEFGELITADHLVIADDGQQSRHGDMNALVMQDKATMWIWAYPNPSRHADGVKRAFDNFIGTQKVDKFFSDGAPEIIRGGQIVGLRHDVSTPYRPQSNGVAERAVRRCLEGARALLLQSGLPHPWWSEALQCYCALRNFADDVRDGNSSHFLRHGTTFDGHLLPFGCVVDY